MQTKKLKEYQEKYRELNREKRREQSRQWSHDNSKKHKIAPACGMLKEARKRAKKNGLPCSISLKDIIVPDVCPIFGIRIIVGSGMWTDNSPSLDRIIPELGYIPGNVAVISHRANEIKRHGTAEEHQRIADWIKANAPKV